MLDLLDVQKYFDSSLHGKVLAMYREYLQCVILKIVFNTKYSHNLRFIGGTALRIVHGNHRFSEDIDFDFTSLSFEEFTQIGDIVSSELNKLGFEVETKFVKKEAFHCYIRLPKILYRYGISPLLDQKILIQLDAAAQGYTYEPEIITLNRFDVFTDIFVAPIDLLLAQKFWAVLNRKRAKGRDFYDIVFLLGFAKPNYEYLAQKAGIENAAQLKSAVLEKTSDLDFTELASDVAPFLFDREGEGKVKNFLKVLESL